MTLCRWYAGVVEKPVYHGEDHGHPREAFRCPDRVARSGRRALEHQPGLPSGRDQPDALLRHQGRLRAVGPGRPGAAGTAPAPDAGRDSARAPGPDPGDDRQVPNLQLRTGHAAAPPGRGVGLRRPGAGRVAAGAAAKALRSAPMAGAPGRRAGWAAHSAGPQAPAAACPPDGRSPGGHRGAPPRGTWGARTRIAWARSMA